MFFFLEQRNKISCERLVEGCPRLQEERVEANPRGRRRRLGGASPSFLILHPLRRVLGCSTFRDSFPIFPQFVQKGYKLVALAVLPWRRGRR